MKILVISNSLPPSGGSEGVAWELAKSYSSDSKSAILVFSKERSHYFSEGVEIYTLPIVKNPFFHYYTFGRNEINNILNIYKPDLIHVHNFPNILSYVALSYDCFKFLTMHNSPYSDYNRSYYFKYKERFLLRSIKDFDLISTPSKRMQKYFSERFLLDVKRISNGINKKTFQLNNSIKRPLNTILYVGSLKKDKKVEVLFRLSKLLKDFDIKLIGDGPLINSVNYPNISFLGKISNSSLTKYYNASTFSIFPGSNENFPLVGLEAMSSGSIVIANKNGFEEYIEDGYNGFLLSQCSAKEIAIKINDIIKNIDLEKVRKNAVKSSNHFSWRKVSNKYIEYYNKYK